MSFTSFMFYFGFFIFFFVFGGIFGSMMFKNVENIFLISGFCVSIFGMFLGRFLMNLMGQ
ncbi:MAG: hypothetical protein KatS3mg002_0033 [Candidatus Woesearchaeota archaeon]|nr:MAG: hypothetical protein KatS3mg002_0033 [Candidatus Woesearchaeota archaeon]